jgi:hypothetical protein
MGWSFSDLIQFAQDLVGADTGSDGREGSYLDTEYNTFDEDSDEYGASDLSIDEMRQSFEEYEDILRS